jgi:xylulokinase
LSISLQFINYVSVGDGMADFALGIDFGTSGARAIVLDAAGQIQAQASKALLKPHQPDLWRSTLFQLLQTLPLKIRQQVGAIAVNGTSSTVLLCDALGEPLSEGLMYNDDRAKGLIPMLEQIAPSQHPVISSTSSLAKLLWLKRQPTWAQAKYFLHQADWIAALLHGQWGWSDYHNALKLGYDVGELRYPDWVLARADAGPLLPQVVAPGAVMGMVQGAIAQTWGFPSDCLVCAGTTDSIAAFLASGVTQPGEAVTSLGSTLVLKLLSTERVDDSSHGVYSHRLGDLWLVGGASNTGGAVLRNFFTDKELDQFSKEIDPNHRTGLNYYPLLRAGDRFPVNDPAVEPRLEPRPASPVAFLQGLLEGIAQIEAQGYHCLRTLGATPLISVQTAGGGAFNPTWTTIRQMHLNVPIRRSAQTEAAYGTAQLALKTLLGRD